MAQNKIEFNIVIFDIFRKKRRVLTKHNFENATDVEQFRLGYLTAAVNNGCTYNITNPDCMTFTRKNGTVETMMTTSQQDEKVHDSWNWKKYIACRKCGWGLFFSRGRSLDHFNWQCSNCGERCSTMTETGMSA